MVPSIDLQYHLVLLYLAMGIAALTILPALLLIFGRAAFFPFVLENNFSMNEELARRKKKVVKVKNQKAP